MGASTSRRRGDPAPETKGRKGKTVRSNSDGSGSKSGATSRDRSGSKSGGGDRAPRRTTRGGKAGGGSRVSARATLEEMDGGASPASRRALRNQGKRTMRRLLDAAMEAFDRRGYHATRVNDVVELARTSHGTFYLYFSNKEDLLRALVQEAATEVQQLDEALAAGPSGTSWEELRSWIEGYSAMWRRYAPLLRAWTDLARTDPELAKLVRATLGTMTGALAEWIRTNDPAPGTDPAVAGVAVMAMLDRFHYLREFMGQPVDEACLDTLTTLVHRGALAGPSRTRSRRT